MKNIWFAHLAALVVAVAIISGLVPTFAQAQGYLQAAACWLSGSSTVCAKPVNVASGGTGAASLTTNSLVLAQGTSALTVVTADTGTTHVLHGGTPPTFGAVAAGDLPAATNAAAGSVSYEDSGTTTLNFTGAQTSSVTLRWSRVGKNVNFVLPISTNASCSAGFFNTGSGAIPSGLRPQAQQNFAIFVEDNAADQSTPGALQILSDGTVQITKTWTTANFTNGANCRFYGTSFSYTVN